MAARPTAAKKTIPRSRPSPVWTRPPLRRPPPRPPHRARSERRGAKKGPRPLNPDLPRVEEHVPDPAPGELVCPVTGAPHETRFQRKGRSARAQTRRVLRARACAAASSSRPRGEGVAYSPWPADVMPRSRIDASVRRLGAVRALRRPPAPITARAGKFARHGVDLAPNTVGALVRLAEGKSSNRVYRAVVRQTLACGYLMMDPTPVRLRTRTQKGLNERSQPVDLPRPRRPRLFFSSSPKANTEAPLRKPSKTTKVSCKPTERTTSAACPRARGHHTPETVGHMCGATFVKAEGRRRSPRKRVARLHRPALPARNASSAATASTRCAPSNCAAATACPPSTRSLPKPAPSSKPSAMLKNAPAWWPWLTSWRAPAPCANASCTRPSRIDNNLAENALRPIKLGAKKNWLFIGHEKRRAAGRP